MSVTDLRPVLTLDGNLMPVGYQAAVDTATRELYELVQQELPSGTDSFLRLTLDEAGWIAGRVVGAALCELRKQQGVRG